eukprot:9041878-Alexandrium_andersonii.AAC.1
MSCSELKAVQPRAHALADAGSPQLVAHAFARRARIRQRLECEDTRANTERRARMRTSRRGCPARDSR